MDDFSGTWLCTDIEGDFGEVLKAMGAGKQFIVKIVSMPPPNVTGYLHMGHAMFVALQDIMTRYARMLGRPTLFV